MGGRCRLGRLGGDQPGRRPQGDVQLRLALLRRRQTGERPPGRVRQRGPQESARTSMRSPVLSRRPMSRTGTTSRSSRTRRARWAVRRSRGSPSCSTRVGRIPPSTTAHSSSPITRETASGSSSDRAASCRAPRTSRDSSAAQHHRSSWSSHRVARLCTST